MPFLLHISLNDCNASGVTIRVSHKKSSHERLQNKKSSDLTVSLSAGTAQFEGFGSLGSDCRGGLPCTFDSYLLVLRSLPRSTLFPYSK